MYVINNLKDLSAQRGVTDANERLSRGTLPLPPPVVPEIPKRSRMSGVYSCAKSLVGYISFKIRADISTYVLMKKTLQKE